MTEKDKGRGRKIEGEKLHRGRWCPYKRHQVKRCQGCVEGIAGVACAIGLVPEVGGPGLGALMEQRFLRASQVPDLSVPRQGGRERGPDVHVPPHLSTAKPLGIYLSLSMSGCARLCLCEPCQPCVCACLCLYISRAFV